MTCADFNGTTNLSLAAHADKPEETRCWVLHLQNLGREGGKGAFAAPGVDVRCAQNRLLIIVRLAAA